MQYDHRHDAIYAEIKTTIILHSYYSHDGFYSDVPTTILQSLLTTPSKLTQTQIQYDHRHDGLYADITKAIIL